MPDWFLTPASYESALVIYAVVALATFAILWFINAPYGRYTRPGWGPLMNETAVWMTMETVALLVMPLVTLLVAPALPLPLLILVALWVVHYANRAFVYPLRRQSGGKRAPVLIPLIAIFFNILNGYANGMGLGFNVDLYASGWLTDPRFILGVGLFLTGGFINNGADTALFRLRREKGPGYHVPNAGLHNYIAAPNYFGEILQWIGFALAAWSLAALLFALYTIANLMPRAKAHLTWYRATFPDYPASRKALIPHVW